MTWKKIIPFGALAAFLLIAVTYRWAPANKPTTQNTPNQSQPIVKNPAPLTNTDIDRSVDELAADLLAEDATLAYDEITADELYANYELIYESYEL